MLVLRDGANTDHPSDFVGSGPLYRAAVQGFVQGYRALYRAIQSCNLQRGPRSSWKSISIVPRGVGSFQVRLECEGLFEKSEEPGSHPGLSGLS